MVAAVVAAAVLALCVRPQGPKEVVTHLLAGELSECPSDVEGSVELICRDNGSVELIRHGVQKIGMQGAVSIAVSVKGFDILIEERLTPGYIMQDQPVDARFTLDFLGAERYHIRYESETTGSNAVMTLTNKPGVEICRPLKQ